jgi:hypothetical protein
MEEKKLNLVENPTPASAGEEKAKHIVLRKLEEVATTVAITDPIRWRSL